MRAKVQARKSKIQARKSKIQARRTERKETKLFKKRGGISISSKSRIKAKRKNGLFGRKKNSRAGASIKNKVQDKKLFANKGYVKSILENLENKNKALRREPIELETIDMRDTEVPTSSIQKEALVKLPVSVMQHKPVNTLQPVEDDEPEYDELDEMPVYDDAVDTGSDEVPKEKNNNMLIVGVVVVIVIAAVLFFKK